jgi:hypothetical protein
VSRKRYRRQTKNARNAVNKHDLDMSMGAIVLGLECADLTSFDSSNAKISPRKILVRFATGPSLEIQIGPMESSTAAATAISLERILSNLQEYCFSERTV